MFGVYVRAAIAGRQVRVAERFAFFLVGLSSDGWKTSRTPLFSLRLWKECTWSLNRIF